MAWSGPAGCLPSGLSEGGRGPPFLLSFLEGTGSQGGLGSLVRDVGGEGLVPQGWAFIKQREGVTEGQGRAAREEQGRGRGPPVSGTSKRKRGKDSLQVNLGTGAGHTSRPTKKAVLAWRSYAQLAQLTVLGEIRPLSLC